VKRILGLAVIALMTSAAAPGGGFVDHFAQLDSARWQASDGWSNGGVFLNDWRRSQLRTGGGGLTVTLDQNPASKNGYSSGEIQSRQVYRYGYFEARMTAAAGSGVVTGFFTYTGPPRGKPWNEVDVEILGRNTRSVQLTYHNGNDQHGLSVDLPFDAAARSHIFGFDWQPGYIRWYVDGKIVHEETGEHLPIPGEAQQIFFDVWNSNSLASWMGRFTWPGQPITAQLQCVATSPRFTGPLC
jgi:endo-1,3-1,4-beta-glycanase ExoK